MNNNTKLVLAVIGVSAIAAYIASKKKATNTTKQFAGVMGDRLGADGLLDRAKKAWKSNKYLPQYGVSATSVRFDSKGFADGGYVNKGDMYNNNQRYGTGWIGDKMSLTGAPTFFTNQSEKLNY